MNLILRLLIAPTIRVSAMVAWAAILGVLGGCLDPGHSPQAERNGKTFYLDGAGNWGYGMADVPRGLQQAEYQGDVEVFVWTTSAFPLVDQLNIGGA